MGNHTSCARQHHAIARRPDLDLADKPCQPIELYVRRNDPIEPRPIRARERHGVGHHQRVATANIQIRLRPARRLGVHGAEVPVTLPVLVGRHGKILSEQVRGVFLVAVDVRDTRSRRGSKVKGSKAAVEPKMLGLLATNRRNSTSRVVASGRTVSSDAPKSSVPFSTDSSTPQHSVPNRIGHGERLLFRGPNRGCASHLTRDRYGCQENEAAGEQHPDDDPRRQAAKPAWAVGSGRHLSQCSPDGVAGRVGCGSSLKEGSCDRSPVLITPVRLDRFADFADRLWKK